MVSGWNLWVWLQCIGVAKECCCKELYTIIINFPYSTCISSFLATASLLLCSFLKCFFCLVYVIFLQYISKRYSKNIRDRSKNRDHANIIIKLYS